MPRCGAGGEAGRSGCSGRNGNNRAECALEHERDRELGYPSRLECVECGQVPTVVGTSACLGGVLDHGAGHLHPLNLCLGEAAGRVCIAHPARSGRLRLSSRWTHTGGLAPELRGYTLPAGSYQIATGPLSEEVALELFPRDSANCDTNVLLDYYRLTPDRRILFGGRCHHTGRVPSDIKGAPLPQLLSVPAVARDPRGP